MVADLHEESFGLPMVATLLYKLQSERPPATTLRTALVVVEMVYLRNNVRKIHYRKGGPMGTSIHIVLVR